MNVSHVSSLDLRNMVYVNFVKSSTITRIYFFPSLGWTLTGPHRSMWSSSRGWLVMTCFFCLNEDLVCFPLARTSQILSSANLIFGITLTRSLATNLFKSDELICPSLWCHRSVLLLWALRHGLITWYWAQVSNIYVLASLGFQNHFTRIKMSQYNHLIETSPHSFYHKFVIHWGDCILAHHKAHIFNGMIKWYSNLASCFNVTLFFISKWDTSTVKCL